MHSFNASLFGLCAWILAVILPGFNLPASERVGSLPPKETFEQLRFWVMEKVVE